MQTKASERIPRSLRPDARTARVPLPNGVSIATRDCLACGSPDHKAPDCPELRLNATLRELDDRRERVRLRRAIRLATLELNVTLRALELRSELVR